MDSMIWNYETVNILRRENLAQAEKRHRNNRFVAAIERTSSRRSKANQVSDTLTTTESRLRAYYRKINEDKCCPCPQTPARDTV